MCRLNRSQIEAATKRTPWHLSNEVLYSLCQKHPRHSEVEAVVAKVLMIGRVYAAAIERRKSKGEENDNFYISTVAPKIINSPIDQWIEEAKRVDPATPEGRQVMLRVHALTTNLFHAISGQEKRSLASKYLHFHVPELFFIYDTRAVKGISAVSSVVGRAPRHSGSADHEYQKFAGKCSRLKQHCATAFGVHLSPRQIDNLLLLLYESGT